MNVERERSYSRAVWGVALVVLAVALAASLGVWQLWRAQVKVQAQAQWNASLAQAPEMLSATTLDTVAARVPLRVRARGTWLPERTVWLDNRALGGRAGFWKVTPLRLKEDAMTRDEMPFPHPQSLSRGEREVKGPSPPGRGVGVRETSLPTKTTVVLVLRGWAPRDARDRSQLPATHDAPGEVLIEGLAVAQLSQWLQLSTVPPTGPLPAIWQNLDLPAFAAVSGLSIAPFVLHQTDAVAPQEGLIRVPLQVAVGPQTHYGYATQWFALAALIAGLAIYFVWRQWHLRRLTARTDSV